MGTHGGVRLGAGRQKISKRQLSVRVSDRTFEAIETFGGEADISTAVRQMADYAGGVNFCIDEENSVWAKFTIFDEISASTIPEAFDKLLVYINTTVSSRPPMYACGRNLLTVKGRLPLGNDASLWIWAAARRTTAPTDTEFNDDQQKIVRALENHGLIATWCG